MSADDASSDSPTGALFAGGAAARVYQVLARKYRPRRFEDLIGQEAMVRTLSNAFDTGRIAHAFMLTGVRGVGKTTTARLLARALNYRSETVDGPSIRLDPPGLHCEAIMAGRHPDVLELDAASRTGVADMRDLLDGARYAPVSARHKVYVIDEVHMLSTSAFNALLKTLEEPPAHVKFIFATTEVRKVPVTVLSRCQRFDLKRLAADTLAAHLGAIARAEGADVSEEGLALIARAAEGSVRDGLSLLDQAIVQGAPGVPVPAAAVRDMLGLADRGRLLDVFERAIAGDAGPALTEVTDQMRSGADPAIILKDLLEIAADVSIVQAAGHDYRPPGPADWILRTRTIAAALTPAQAARYWQLLLSGHRDLQVAPDPATALKMVILRLAAAARLPSPEEAARMMSAPPEPAPGKPDTPLAVSPLPGEVASFADVIARLGALREVTLQVDLERYLRPVSFGPGARISCALAPGAPADLLKRLSAFLLRETRADWDIQRASEGGETARAREARLKTAEAADAASHPAVAAALQSLPGAVIVDVRPAPADNVIDLGARRRV
jgi:DNA polymerase III subunit gamma/tau